VHACKVTATDAEEQPKDHHITTPTEEEDEAMVSPAVVQHQADAAHDKAVEGVDVFDH
jgi:hypothetical protein